jgi:hypothetical protein
VVLALVALVAASLAPSLPAATAVEPAQLGFSASAFGTFAFRPGRVVVGRSSVSVIGCTTQAGAHDDNTLASLQAPPLFRTGTINTTADALNITGGKASRSTAQTKNLNALDGLVRADLIRGVSQTSRKTGFATDAAGSTFVDLHIGGRTFDGSVPPNTRVNLPGFGHVVLNEQVRQMSPTSASLTVNMIHVYVTQQNPQEIPKGTQVIVSHAQSALRLRAGTLDGFAYGTRVSLGNAFLSGPSARIYMPCEGSNGTLRQNSLNQLFAAPAVTTGALVTSVRGTVSTSSAQGETTSTANIVNVLDGLISAEVVTAKAQASKTGSTFAFGDAGSMFVDLSVEGFPGIDEDVPPNTSVVIPGVGTLWLHRIIPSPRAIEVRMIELILGSGNPAGLPIGTNIRVSVARASAH